MLAQKDLKIIEDKVQELNWNHDTCYYSGKVIQMSAKMSCKDKEELVLNDVLEIINHLNSSLSATVDY